MKLPPLKRDGRRVKNLPRKPEPLDLSRDLGDGRGFIAGDNTALDRPIDRATWAQEVVSMWGTYLNQEMEKARVGKNKVILWWLGGASFALKTAKTFLLIDNYYGGSMYTKLDTCGVCHCTGAESLNWVRINPMIADPWEFRSVAAHLSTHQHVDHCDIYTVKALLPNTKAVFVGPDTCQPKLEAWGVPKNRMKIVRPGAKLKFGDVSVDVIESYDPAALNTGRIGEQPKTMDDTCVMYLFKTPGGNILHAGDIIYNNKFAGVGLRHKIDVALLPTGRVWRGVTDKMSYFDCYRIAEALRCKVLIPMHYDNWTNSQGNPQDVVDLMKKYAPQIKTIVLQWGARFEYPTDADIGRYAYPSLEEGMRIDKSWQYGSNRNYRL
jgi:L-ascorbate 6-phosphate lactonase